MSTRGAAAARTGRIYWTLLDRAPRRASRGVRPPSAKQSNRERPRRGLRVRDGRSLEPTVPELLFDEWMHLFPERTMTLWASPRLRSASRLVAVLVAFGVALHAPARLVIESSRPENDFHEVEAQFARFRGLLPPGSRVGWLAAPNDRAASTFFQCLGAYALVPLSFPVVGIDQAGGFDYLAVQAPSYSGSTRLALDTLGFDVLQRTPDLVLIRKVPR
jgi:hypothetical protein